VCVDSSGTEADGDSYAPSLSADGSIVAFTSTATNLVVGDTNQFADLFVHDRTTGVTERVSVDASGIEADGASGCASLTADGQGVTFASAATNLVVGDINARIDLFFHDRSSGVTECVSVAASGGAANGDSGDLYYTRNSVSADGRFVAFWSKASNLVAGDGNGVSDVFVRDRMLGGTRRASVDSQGVAEDDDSGLVSISSDGQFVAFDSLATNLVAGDTNGFNDVFVHERCGLAAGWTNYGAGLPGTIGVPSLMPRANPTLGTNVTVDLGNSFGTFTIGVLFVGWQRASLPTGWGGELLVQPAITQLDGLAPDGMSFSGDIPDDDAVCGVAVDLQAIEADAGAVDGVSFTAGLELVLGI
jgi:hypothetical protein